MTADDWLLNRHIKELCIETLRMAKHCTTLWYIKKESIRKERVDIIMKSNK